MTVKFKKLKLIYFSPTGTTQKILQGIAKGANFEEIEHINLTLPQVHQPIEPTFSDELAVIGTPVYGGRLPVDAINRLKQLKANSTLAVIIVTYGNRDFEDALLELKNLAIEIGFKPIAGGAFVGEHSFATKDLPIANGRPDSLDIDKAFEFGEKIKIKVTDLQSPHVQMDLEIPGRYPYVAVGARSMAVSPVTKEDKCTLCGTCADACPTAAICVAESITTKTEQCIRCCACIKNCPTGARMIEDNAWKSIATWINVNCSTRKEPQVFGVNW
jgi:ferredoxin